MEKIKMIFTLLITLILSIVLIVFFGKERTEAKESPRELYQVYLGGEEIGVIKSKEALEKYINDMQEEVKKKYHVSNVYPPNDLNVQKYIGYEKNILSEKKVYEMIKEKNPFTIKGYVVTIKKENPININILDQDLFKDAAEMTIKAFVSKEEYQMYKDDTQPEIKSVGKLIERLDLNPWPTVRAAYIPVDEYIFTDVKELAKYLLFGTLEEQKTYVVKSGDTIENIANDNKLGVEEFLIVNPGFTNANNLLFPGQKVMVGYISPLFNVIEEQHIVEDRVKQFTIETQYDKTLATGKSYVKQEGTNGLDRVTQKVRLINGEIDSLVITNSENLKPAINKIIVKGSKTKNPSNPVIITNDTWFWPTKTPYVITSYYGWRWGRMHEGIDISGTGLGSPIYAANGGRVIKSYYAASGYGNCVIIEHSGGIYTLYAHMNKRSVYEGDTVRAGQMVGTMGRTGRTVGVTGVHLHYGAYTGGVPHNGGRNFDPLQLYK